MNRYQVLRHKRGADDSEETKSIFVRRSNLDKDKILLTEVLKQDPEALDKVVPTGIAWEELASNLKRPRDQLYRDWTNRILPTLRRHLAGGAYLE